MNDLAEKALHGLDTARRAIVARPSAALAVAGFLIASAVVVTGGRLGAAPAAVPLNRWLGLLPEAGYQITDAAVGLVMLAATAALLTLWLLTLMVSRRSALRPRQLYSIAGAWTVPFALGPPLLSTEVYTGVAHGLLARNGLSPYHHPPSALGHLRVVAAIDPAWRGAQSTDGPLATLAQHIVVSLTGGGAIGAVIVWRVIAVLSVIVIGRFAVELAGPRRTAALSLIVLNPAVLIVVVS
ncbi:MAG: hypothetical protein ACRDVG_06335, partial [Jatrophihabitantaceae bacterium]